MGSGQGSRVWDSSSRSNAATQLTVDDWASVGKTRKPTGGGSHRRWVSKPKSHRRWVSLAVLMLFLGLVVNRPGSLWEEVGLWFRK